MNMTQKQVISEIRKAAKAVGLTFKVENSCTINNHTAYKFVTRSAGQTVMNHCTLGSAYENVCSGFIASWNGTEFKGI